MSSLAHADETTEISFDDLFRRSAIQHAALSPSGEFAAYFRYNMLVIGNTEIGFHDIHQFSDHSEILDIDWIGVDTVWVTTHGKLTGGQSATAIRLGVTEDGGYGSAKIRMHYDSGYVSDPLLDDRDQVVFARARREKDFVATELFRINVFESTDRQFKRHNRVDTGSRDFYYYVTNTRGDYVLGIRFVDNRPQIWRKPANGKDWVQVWVSEDESSFIPWQVSSDGRTLWVLSNASTDKVAAVEFDLVEKQFSDVLFEHERVDVDTILLGRDSGEPVGVTYLEGGLLRYHYFAQEEQQTFDDLSKHFPDQGIIVIGYSADETVRLVFASSATDRGGIHLCDTVLDRCNFIESIAPWLDGKGLSEVVALNVQSSDDFVIEAFLSIPVNADGKVPLVALPHGGPIGVNDDRYFSADVQWLTSNGYAVVQVNYRGSAGYGQDFKSAGLREWGRGIEDDIEAAVQQVIETYPEIDGTRVGIFGGSYGGYSALMSVARNPELFKCAASWAGVTDLTLLFTQTVATRSETMREIITRYVGDPDIDIDEQTQYSPVYRYRDLVQPILLGHGVSDRVVDIEHSRRLQKMLQLSGADSELLEIPDVGHGFATIDEASVFYGRLIEFLDEHLEGAVAVDADDHYRIDSGG